MKIAIMTWFHYRNYGTALQVSALSNYLTGVGHTVDVINYIPSDIKQKTIEDYRFSEVIRRHRNRNGYYPSYLGKHFCDEDKENLFQTYLNKRIALTKECNTLTDLEYLNSQYDVFICGSDQIWAPSCFDSHYFLDFVYDNKKMVAYAPSIGLTIIQDRFIKKEMRRLIDRFDHLSVREISGAQTIKSLTGKTAEIVVDPTLLFNDMQWERFCKIYETDYGEYLLVYFLGNNINHWKCAYKLAEKMHLEVKIIPVFENDLRRDGCIDTPVGPEEFVKYIKNAAYVCTDSFHGTLFSIIFHKNFTSIERFKSDDPVNQNSRIVSLFNKLGLENVLVQYNTSEITENIIDYSEVDEKINILRDSSKAYLSNAMNSIESINIGSVNKNSVLSDHSLCCGCGACANVCSVNAISIKLDYKGFYRANVDRDKCVDCGRCISVCPFNKSHEVVKAMDDCDLYSYKDYDKNVLKLSSSGGFAYRLSAYLLENGYAVVGCTFDKKTQSAKHILINTITELNLLQGSKYMQSSFTDVIEDIKRCKKPVAIFGTPCQISASRKLFKDRKDYIYVDLICHGVPSYNLYIKYRDYLSKRFRMEKNTFSVQYRYKPKGWREIYIYSESGTQKQCFHQNEDLYFRMFETGNCYMESCYDCRWRDCTAADIRIGDYWGIRYEYDSTGVSMVVCANERGLEIVEQMNDRNLGRIKECPIEDYIQCQQTMNLPKPLFYEELMGRLSDNTTDLSLIVDKYSLPFERKSQSRKEHILSVAKLILDSKNDE